jgi:hypothetical protein
VIKPDSRSGPGHLVASELAAPVVSDVRRRHSGAAAAFVPQRTGRASAMYLGSTFRESGRGVPSSSTGRVEPSGVTAASSVRGIPVLSGACPTPSTRSDQPLRLSYQRRAPAPYGSGYQSPECSRDSVLWTLFLLKGRAMTISFRRASLPTAYAPSPSRWRTYLLRASVAIIRSFLIDGSAWFAVGR